VNIFRNILDSQKAFITTCNIHHSNYPAEISTRDTGSVRSADPDGRDNCSRWNLFPSIEIIETPHVLNRKWQYQLDNKMYADILSLVLDSGPVQVFRSLTGYEQSSLGLHRFTMIFFQSIR